MTNSKGTVLIVDDEEYVRQSLEMVFERDGYTVRTADSPSQASTSHLLEGLDAAVVDLRMPGSDGLSLIRRLHDLEPHLPVIVLTAHGSVASAVESIKAGAYDFLQKPADPAKLLVVLERALEDSRLKRELRYLRRAGRDQDRSSGPIGRSPGWRRVVEMASVAAPTDSSVLILGESGTGKEELARLIHRRSKRSERSFVKVNCAAVPLDLFESEFFGHRKGAFTGAVSDHDGLFRVAHMGTLLLDEIGLMPPQAQAKVLRVLEDGTFQRVGDARPTEVNVRLIAASNADLASEVEEGKFRSDLFYRINVVSIEIPPLRQRKEDISLLCEAFREEFAHKLAKPLEGFEEDALDVLLSYSWPGNVRELRNVVERAMILEKSARITTSSLPLHVSEGASGQSGTLNLRKALAIEERRLIKEALRRSQGVRRQAAGLLGIDERNMSYFLKKHGLN